MEDRGYAVDDVEWEAVGSTLALRRATEEFLADPDPDKHALGGGYNPLFRVYKGVDAAASLPRILVWYIYPAPKEVKSAIKARAHAMVHSDPPRADYLIAVYFTSKSNNPGLLSETLVPFEEFDLDWLEINPYRTSFGDTITRLSTLEAELLCLENGLSAREMSGISKDDAVIRYLGIPLRAIVRVESHHIISMYSDVSVSYHEVRNRPTIYKISGREDDEDEEAGDEPLGHEA